MGIQADLDLTFTVGILLGDETEVALSSVYAPYSIVSLIRDDSGTAKNPVPSDGILTNHARFRLTLSGIGPADVELFAADAKEWGFNHTETGTGSLTATSPVVDPSPEVDVAFDLVVDGASHPIVLAKTVTDDNGTDKNALVSDLTTALTDAGLTDITVSLSGSDQVVLSADAVTTTLAVQSLGTTQDNSDRADLAKDLQDAIDRALSDAGLVAAIKTEAIDTDTTSTGSERLRISSFSTPFMQIDVCLPPHPCGTTKTDLGGFASLGLDNGQEATSSPLPSNGILSGTAEFDLTVFKKTTSTLVSKTVSVAQDLDNDNVTGTTARLEALRRRATGGQYGLCRRFRGRCDPSGIGGERGDWSLFEDLATGEYLLPAD